MKSKRGGIKLWIIFFVVIIGALAILANIKTNVEQKTDSVNSESKNTTATIKKPNLPKKPKPTDEEISKQNDAVTIMALKKAAPNECESIQFNEEQKTLCLDNVYFSLAISGDNEAECRQIKDESIKSRCLNKIYSRKAVDTKNQVFCSKITDEQKKADCSDRVQVLLSQKQTKISFCDTMQSENLKQLCLDNIYFNLGRFSGNTINCSKISDKTLNDRCFTVTENQRISMQKASLAPSPSALPSEKRLDECKSLSKDTRQNCEDDVNYEMAFEKKDVSICDKLSENTLQNKCRQEQGTQIAYTYLRQALAEQNPALCNNISSIELKQTCITISK